MEQFISMIATDSTCQFCFFKMVCHRQLHPQWSNLTEKGFNGLVLVSNWCSLKIALNQSNQSFKERLMKDRSMRERLIEKASSEHQFENLSEDIDLYIGLLTGILVTYQNQLPRFRMFQKKQPMNKLSQRLFHQFRDINTSYSVIWIYLRASLVNAGVRDQSRTHSLCTRPLANNSYRFVVITFYPLLSFKLRCRL